MSEKDNTKKFEYDKTYYFDRSGISINESEIKDLHVDDMPIIKSCCRLKLPKGFKFYDDFPGMCFNISNLSCVKNPIIKNVTLPTSECKSPMECEVVAGYEILVVGDIQFSISAPLIPKNGCCFPIHSHTCCTTTATVYKTISYTCCAKACPKTPSCIDWILAFFNIKLKEDDCGQYLQVNMGVALEYAGNCECDDE
jgi:hypothetical protein